MSSLIAAAADDLLALLADGPVARGVALERMAGRGHPASRVDLARRRLGVRTIRTGPPGTKQVFYWELPTHCPTCHQRFRADGWDLNNFEGMYEAPIEEPEPEVITPIEPASAVKPRPAFRSSDGPSTCGVCGRTWMLPAGRRCIGLVTDVDSSRPARPCPGWLT
jgi:hypothetical protein